MSRFLCPDTRNWTRMCGGSENRDSLFKYQTPVGWEVGQGALEEGYPLSDTVGRQIGPFAQGTLVGWVLSLISL